MPVAHKQQSQLDEPHLGNIRRLLSKHSRPLSRLLPHIHKVAVVQSLTYPCICYQWTVAWLTHVPTAAGILRSLPTCWPWLQPIDSPVNIFEECHLRASLQHHSTLLAMGVGCGVLEYWRFYNPHDT